MTTGHKEDPNGTERNETQTRPAYYIRFVIVTPIIATGSFGLVVLILRLPMLPPVGASSGSSTRGQIFGVYATFVSIRRRCTSFR